MLAGCVLSRLVEHGELQNISFSSTKMFTRISFHSKYIQAIPGESDHFYFIIPNKSLQARLSMFLS